MKVLIQILSTLAVLVLGAALGYWIYVNRPEAPKKPEVRNEVLVRCLTVAREDVRFRIPSQGTVRPRTETALVAEVAGRVLEVTPDFEEGAFFAKDALLARIEDVDYKLEVVRARAQVANANTTLAQTEAEAKIAVEEWKREGRSAPVPALVAREPQLEAARAALESAKAQLARAQRDLERTTIRAPYAGRVRTRNVDRGAYATRGSALGRIYAVDWVEVTLPLTPDETAFLNLPRPGLVKDDKQAKARVVLKATIAGEAKTWNGELVRTRGEIDARTRMIEAVARIRDPYGIEDATASNTQGRSLLAVGQFVRAEIEGKEISGLIRIPRAALRDGNQVLTVVEDKIRTKTVSILRRERNEVLLDGGLENGDQVVISPLEVWTNGMAVRIARESVQQDAQRESEGETKR